MTPSPLLLLLLLLFVSLGGENSFEGGGNYSIKCERGRVPDRGKEERMVRRRVSWIRVFQDRLLEENLFASIVFLRINLIEYRG